MGRPIGVLSCYRARKHLSAYLDDALPEARRQWTERHVAGCASCQGDVGQLRRMKTLLSEMTVPEPDWAGFWPGIVRGVQDARQHAVPRTRRRMAWGLRPRLALGGAALASLVLALTLWQHAPGPTPAEAGVVVTSANTDHPQGTVMVYTPADRDLAVVWVFDTDDD